MFDRFVRFAQARKALSAGHFEQALRLAQDPLVRSHRRAEEIREEALAGLERRARQRADCGSLSAAFVDVERLIAEAPERGTAVSLRDELRTRSNDEKARAESAARILAEAEAAVERGELRTGESLCRAAVDAGAAAPSALLAAIHARRQRATELLGEASAARRASRFGEARARLREARALDRSLPDAGTEAAALAAALAPDLARRIRQAAADGEAAVLSLVDRERSDLPELDQRPEVAAAVREAVGDRRERLAELLAGGDVAAAVDTYRSLDARVRVRGLLGELGPVLAELERAGEAEARGQFEAAARSIDGVGQDLGLPALRQRAEELRQIDQEVAARLERAGTRAGDGDLPAARELLLSVLADHPRHEVARRELDLLDQGARDQRERLEAARDLVGQGRLREASARLIGLATAGPSGEEARLLLREVRQRMEHVDRGVRAVHREIHGSGSGSIEGLRHQLARIEQLELLQSDSEDLARLREAIVAEISGLEAITAGRRALEVASFESVSEELARLRALRGDLLAPDRLDARILDLVDAVLAAAEEELDRGRLGRAECLTSAVQAWNGDRSVSDRVARIEARIAQRRATAEQEVVAARRALRVRDLAAAEERLVAARAAWADGPEVVRLELDIVSLRRQVARLDRVETMKEKRDVAGARRVLGGSGPTPAFLRTRIYDLKRSLAEAEGLDHAFLLRVDDGGEFLVLRGESLTIGNLREGSADLPVLANLAGCHARLRRTLSFHGGQVDSIEAENGDVRLDGRRVDRHRFGKHDRLRLGSSLELEYELPSSRSLTARLRLRGGFQIAGTDRMLWMKDRGRDGRILIGAGPDAHVSVRSATHEVELFADRDGRIRVRAPEGGRIDGAPFDGEHPVSAGALVECGGVTFVLQPWSRG